MIWPHSVETGQSVVVSRSESPEEWEQYANSDVPVITQWDNGQREGTQPGVVATSSASMPSVVFSMLRDLDVSDGHRVLEIGTGTGWDTALLAHKVGAANVTTVEVDPDVAKRARGKLDSAVMVVTGDGAHGYTPGAPYDRVVVTCGLRWVPFTLVRQIRPGGLIVAPWGTYFSHQDATARLRVSEDGRSASGPFTGPVEFMKMRDQLARSVRHEEYVPDGVSGAGRSSTVLREEDIVNGKFGAAQFAIGLRVPDCVMVPAEKVQGTRPVWFYGTGDRSWACVMFHDGEEEASVWQSGPRRLWDDVATAARWWIAQKCPGHERFGLTITETEHRVWLDDPGNHWQVPKHSVTVES